MKGEMTLMHGADPVAEVKFNKDGYVKETGKVLNPELLPVPAGEKRENLKLGLQKWIMDRALAPARRDLAPLREFYGHEYFVSETGLSLFDHYWFSTPQLPPWEEINPYQNWDPKTDMVYLMLARPEGLMKIDLNSPNLTIPGSAQRFWYKHNGKIVMLNGNAQTAMYEYRNGGTNDCALDRDYVILANKIYVITQTQTSEDTEALSFEDLYQAFAAPSKSKWETLQECCETLQIPHWKEFLSQMMAYDENAGIERELSQVSVLRDVHTLKMHGFAKV